MSKQKIEAAPRQHVLPGSVVWHVILIVLILLTAGFLYWAIDSNTKEIRSEVEALKTQSESDRMMMEGKLQNLESGMMEAKEGAMMEGGDCFAQNGDRTLKVTHPCDWIAEDAGSWISLKSPDGDASFGWPVGSFGLHGFQQTSTSTVQILNQTYNVKKYTNEEAENTFEIVDFSEIKDSNGYSGFIIDYSNSELRDDLIQIIESAEF